MIYWRNLWCCLFHHKSKVWTPVHHSHSFRCLKCGNKGLVDD